MAEQRIVPWADVIEVLHALLTTVVVRGQYPAGHPAVDRADDTATAGLARVGMQVQELVVAIVEHEFVVAERPMPELRDRLPGFADLLLRHDMECLVFARGVTRGEVSALASALAAAPSDERARERERLQALLPHVLLRYVTLREQATEDDADHADNLVPAVQELLTSVVAVMNRNARIDERAVLAVARRVFDGCVARSAPLQLRR